MLINVKTSEVNKSVVTDLTQKFQLGSENIIARIAIAYSISKNYDLHIDSLQDSKGKEYKEDILLGNYKDYYIALISQKYVLYKNDNNIPKYMKLHLDHGLEQIQKFFTDNPNHTGLDFLIESIERGLDFIDSVQVSSDFIRNNNQSVVKASFSDELYITAGTTIDSNEDIVLQLNNTNKHNNAHISVAGNTGTGKTQLALSLLKQFVVNSNGVINYLYLDFKGLKNEDINTYKPFFEETNCSFINSPHTPFPLNPLSFIDSINEKNRIMGINKFVDIIASYSNIGKKQAQILKDATSEAFAESLKGHYPSFKDIYDKVIEITEGKPDTLKEVIESVSELELFLTNHDPNNLFINRNYYFSLSGDLSNSIRLTCTFLIINYIYNIFMNMENSPVEDNLQGLRYVLLIDEAHVIFKEKKSQELLEKILREIRSKGVVVILLSQGIEEFNQPSFDFSSMCETSILLDIKDKTNVKMISRFLGLGERESNLISRSMERIQKGQAISNIKEFKKAELFEISQYWKG